MPLINWEINLILTWSEKCVLTNVTTKTTRDGNPNANPPVEARERIYAPTNATFQIKETKLYVPVVTLSTEDDKNYNEDLKELLNGINTDQKWVIRLKLIT